MRTIFNLPFVSRYCWNSFIRARFRICSRSASFFGSGTRQRAVWVLDEVLFEDGQEFQRLLVLLPDSLGFSHVERLQLLIPGWLALKQTTNPLDGALFVTDKKLQLLDLSYFEPFAVVFADLLRQEEHPVTLWEPLTQPGIEFRG